MSRAICALTAVFLALAPGMVARAQDDHDRAVEACLAEGRILKGEEELIGLTKPSKVEIECGGAVHPAVFKSVDVHKPGLYRLADGSREFNFSDDYRYERAAYLLDRELGLNMVPVAVPRTHRNVDGVLIEWLHGTVFENRYSPPPDGAVIAALTRQKSIMRLFDSLIFNVDRRAENVLIEEATGRLFMIDHSQSFREHRELQETFAEGRIWLHRGVYDRLQRLDEARLEELTQGLISTPQRRALLARRDLILAKIDRDRAELGDALVFVDP